METPRPPSGAVRRTPPEEPMQCEYSSTRMELMETSNGARELVKEDEPYDEEAMAKDLVAAAVKSLETHINSIYDQKLGGGITQGLITCLSNYYTLKEMKAYMTSTTILTAPESEFLFDSLFVDNVGREAYLEHSLRLETSRGRKALKVQPQQQLQVSQKQQVPVSQLSSASCNHDETSTSHVCEPDCKR